MPKTSNIFRVLVSFCVLGCAAGCATNGNGPTTDKGETVIASNSEPGPRYAASGSRTEDRPVVIEEAGMAGTTKNEGRVYCRRHAPIGTRIAKTSCMTEKQREEHQELVKEMLKNSGRKK